MPKRFIVNSPNERLVYKERFFSSANLSQAESKQRKLGAGLLSIAEIVQEEVIKSREFII
ncbi:hypothetical protein LBWT_28520 [Leptolyngbya boryana IAM M-101]|nr:hypothetical protein LBWT_28520 [Leptolyngbya boryana IAM M-101]BAS63273.1 hypothetical protein LBDG_28520 [Leptolyngbya boryana dg5]